MIRCWSANWWHTKPSSCPSGLMRYGAPSGQHDDTVMALAMAWSAVSGQHRLVYPIPDTQIVVKEFAIPDHWPRAYGFDIRWNTVAAIWGAQDPQSDVLYLYSEYCGEADPAIHAAAIRSRADWIPGLIDPAANGRNQADGQKLIQTYRKHGLKLLAIEIPLESGILDVAQRMSSGRLKVFPSLSKYLEERRLYARDEKDQIVTGPRQSPGRLALSGERHLSYADEAGCEHSDRYVPTGEKSWMV